MKFETPSQYSYTEIRTQRYQIIEVLYYQLSYNIRW